VRTTNVYALALTAGLVLAAAPWLSAQVPDPPLLPPVAPPSVTLPLVVPPEPQPVETPPQMEPKTEPPPVVPAPVETAPVPRPLVNETPTAPLPVVKEPAAPPQPVQIAQPSRPPAFRVLGQHAQQGTAPPPPVATATVAERPVLLSTLPPGATPMTPALTLEKKGPPAVQLNQAFCYEITVRNVGAVAAQQVRVEDQLPPGTSFLSAKPAAVPQGERLQWVIDHLAAGAASTILVQVQPTATGEWQGNATLSVAISSGWRTAVSGPQLVLNVIAPSTVNAGSKAVLQVCVTNNGAAPLTGLKLLNRLPAGLECTQALGNEIEATIDRLEPGATRKLDLETIATDAGNQVNETWVTTKEGQHTDARAMVRVVEPVLRLRQTGSARPELLRENEYRLEVVNHDKGDAHTVQVSQVVPEGLKYVSAGEGGVYSPETRTVFWRVPLVPAGQSRTLTLRLMPQTAGLLVTQTTARSDEGHDATLFALLAAQAATTPPIVPPAPVGATPVPDRVP
jgi:uncharacterized repeat protein (TIGR01451 family)